MTFETWIAFAAATAVLLVIPGPTILLVISYALGQGWRLVALLLDHDRRKLEDRSLSQRLSLTRASLTGRGAATV